MSEIDFQQGLLTGMFFNKLTTRGEVDETIKVRNELLLSTLRFNDYSIGTNPKYTDSTTQYSYSQIVTQMTNLQSSYSSDITLDNIGNSYNSNAMYSLRIRDDGSKPILGFSLGIHGNERAVHEPIFETIRNILDATSGILYDIANTFTIIVIGTVNPDGMIADARTNGNSVNLNRNFPYYWDATLDSDKGSSASSEPETQNIQSYLNTSNRVTRVLFWLDVHGWTSKTTWGWLTEQIAHDNRYHNLQRTVYNHMLSMISQIDFSSFTIVNNTPELLEYTSARKPYLYTWVKNRGMRDSYCCIFEYPQSENVGLCCEMFYHMLKGMIIGSYDYYTGVWVGGSVQIPNYYQIINNNSNLTDWNATENRPSWFSRTRLVLDQLTDVDGEKYVESHRKVSSAWGTEVAFGASTNFPGKAFFLITGEKATGLIGTSKGQDEITKDNISLPSITTASTNAAACNDGTYIYVVGGYNSGYLTSIYRIDPFAVTPSWSLWSNLSSGRQRHTCHVYDGYIWVVGGRTSSGYSNEIRKISLSTKAETLFGTFTTIRGWHTSAIYDGYLYIVGGWSGVTARDNIRKIDLSTGSETTISLPGTLRRHSMPVNDSLAYIIGGDDGSGTFNDEIWELDMSTDTVTNISYDRDSTEDEDGNIILIPKPELIGGHGFFDSSENKYNMVGGEDSSGLFYDSVYEFDPDEEDGVLYIREALQNTWGYFRPSSKFNCSVGESYAINVEVRNEGAINDVVNPYIRLMILTNPISTYNRKIRTQYVVPSQDWQKVSLAFDVESGEYEFRVYIRHYGNNTKIGIKKFQLCNRNTNGVVEW